MKVFAKVTCLTLVLAAFACGTQKKSDNSSELASVTVSAIKNFSFVKGTLSLVDIEGKATDFDFASDSLSFKNFITIGTYSARISLKDAEGKELAANTIFPCQPNNVALAAGENVLSLSVCTKEGTILKPLDKATEKASATLDIKLEESSLFLKYILSCNRGNNHITGATYITKNQVSTSKGNGLPLKTGVNESGSHYLDLDSTPSSTIVAKLDDSHTKIVKVVLPARSQGEEDIEFLPYECLLSANSFE